MIAEFDGGPARSSARMVRAGAQCRYAARTKARLSTGARPSTGEAPTRPTPVPDLNGWMVRGTNQCLPLADLPAGCFLLNFLLHPSDIGVTRTLVVAADNSLITGDLRPVVDPLFFFAHVPVYGSFWLQPCAYLSVPTHRRCMRLR